jgi:hypothetical protein
MSEDYAGPEPDPVFVDAWLWDGLAWALVRIKI